MGVAASKCAVVLACLLAAAVLAAGCGGDSDTSDGTGGSRAAAESRPAPPKSAFPDPAGQSLEQLLKGADAPTSAAGIVISPAAMVFYAGENRYPFGLSGRDGRSIDDAEVALYYAKVPTVKPGAKSKSGNKGLAAKAEAQALDEPAIGPFPAKIESLASDPEFESKTTSEDPDARKVIYASEVDFPGDGEYRPALLIKTEGETFATTLPGADVGEFTAIPRAGEPAPRIHTPTAADVDGDLSQLTTRVPPERQNKVDYADALGREPIVLLFATPQFCQSRVCGPVVDLTEQAKREFGDEAAFIHMEIYNDNDPAKFTRPQVRDFSLPSEPWLFTIDRDGIVSDAVEGAFGSELLDEAIEQAIR
jgi:hypothetical protein